MTAIETVLEVLDGARKSGAGWSAKCPAHEDHRASLSISEGADGKVLLYCHAGCTFASIVAAAGLEESDLFPPKDASGKRIVAEYSYTDETGAELSQAVRFEPKDFRQRHREKSGAWTWSIEGIRRVPYHLPELREGVEAGATPYVVEGEKDADALRALGLVATCNAGGAGKWRLEFSEYLKDARVVVIADKDGPGRKHAAAVEASLRGKAAFVIVVEVPKGKDAADWIAQGAGREDFEKLAASGVSLSRLLATFTALELDGMDLQEPRYACAGLVVEGLSFLAGKPKLGKSWLALQLAIAVALGEPWLGGLCEQGEVLYLALEDSKRRLQPRVRIVLGHRRLPPTLTFSTECPRLDEGGLDLISAWLTAHPEARLVIIDTLAKVKPGRKRNGDVYAEDNDAGSRLQALAFKHRVAVLVVHHTRKAGAEDFLEEVSGTFGLTGAADSVLVLRRNRQAAEGTLSVTGRDIEECELALSFARNALWTTRGEAAAVPVTQERRDVLEALFAAGRDSSRSPALSTGEVAKSLGKGVSATSYLLTRMATEGQVHRGVKFGTWLPGDGLTNPLEVLEPLKSPVKPRQSGDSPNTPLEVPLEVPSSPLEVPSSPASTTSSTSRASRASSPSTTSPPSSTSSGSPGERQEGVEKTETSIRARPALTPPPYTDPSAVARLSFLARRREAGII
jgi:5S rRNA maturation endonuclease (ribonuclease M5)